jgi:hypothetical protein
MKFFNKIYCVFFLCHKEKKIFNIFKKNKNSLNGKNDIVLIQCVEDYYYYGLFGTIVSSLKMTSNIKVDQYIVRNLTVGSMSSVRGFIISILFSNRFRDDKWKRLYSSYCDRVAFRHEGSSSIIFDIKALFKAFKIYKKIKTRRQLLELTLEGVKIGDLIYDSYLRFRPAPTVDINDYYLCIIIWQSLRNIDMTKKYFIKNKPSIFLTSYSTYIQHGIAVRVALQFDTKVYSFGNFQMPYKRLTKSDYYHTANCDNYKPDFENLPDKGLNLAESESALNARLGGKNDTSTAYMKISAYKLSDTYMPNVEGCAVIFLHDFYDSPHVYGHMVFSDFLEWIEFTIEAFEEYRIPYIIKPHPNQIPDSQTVVESLEQKYPNANFISSKITNKQLVDNGVKIGLSVYGTVAHELVYMGIPVILCGKNPHSSYDFCFTARSKNEYRDLLKNCMNINFTQGYKQEVESFYYMHNLNKTEHSKVLMESFIELFVYCNNNKGVFNEMYFIKTLNKIGKNKDFVKFIEMLKRNISVK